MCNGGKLLRGSVVVMYNIYMGCGSRPSSVTQFLPLSYATLFRKSLEILKKLSKRRSRPLIMHIFSPNQVLFMVHYTFGLTYIELQLYSSFA